MRTKINVSIVTYNTSFELIKKLIIQLDKVELSKKIYIVDNSEKPILKEKLKKLLIKDLEYRFNSANLGYGKGHNVAINETILNNVAYHLVINPDVEIKEGAIEKIFDFMEKNKNVGNLMPKVLYPNGNIQYLAKLLPTPLTLFGRRFIPIKSLREKINYYHELRFFDYNSVLNVPNLSGCFMFLRSNILKQIGGFDKRYFMYMEDVDLNRRIYSISETLFYPEVNIVHHYEKGSYKNKKLMKFHIQSAIKYFNKWGWLFDKEREKINKKVLKQFNL